VGTLARAHALLVALRRARALARIRLAARLAGVDLDLDVAPTASLGRMDVRFRSARPVTLHVGPRTTIDDDVEVRFDGGALRIGDWCEIRRGVRMMVAGELDLEGQNLVSWGTTLHCDDGVVVGRAATLSEHVTISDSVHPHVPGGRHLDQLRTAPVAVGADTWVAAKATITHGVRVGDRCVVAAGAVVTRDVPDDHVAAGVPARSRPRERSASPTA
jgi:acetyltransferase-like isoleucine patch superfamily enzyme